MKKGSIQKFSPLHKEIFRASFSGLGETEVARLMGVKISMVHSVMGRAKKLIEYGQFEEYAEILPDPDWSLMKKDNKTGRFTKAFDDGTQMSPQDLKHFKRNEIDQDSSYIASDVHNSEYAKSVIKRSKLSNREFDMTLKHHTEDMTFQQIANEYRLSSPRIQQLVGKTHRELRKGMAGDVNAHIRGTNSEVTKLINERTQLGERLYGLGAKLNLGVDEEREWVRISKRLSEIRIALDSAMDKVRQTLIEH